MLQRIIALVLSFSSFNTIGQIEVSLPEGFYVEPISVEISTSLIGATLHYTTNGTAVSNDDPIITGPISIGESTAPSVLSSIKTSPDWQAPIADLFRSTPLKVRAFQGETALTEEFIFHYFIDPSHTSRYPVSRLLLKVDSIDFFSQEKGIYVPGNNDVFNFYNEGEDWERPLEFMLFSPTGRLEWSQKLGARIHGRSSRTNPQKSLRLYAKSSYGSPFIFHPIFGDADAPAFKRLILRAPDRMFSAAQFTDALVHKLVEPLDLENMNSRTVAVFINGEYWGIQNIRERLDEQHLRINLGVEPNRVDIVDWDREAFATEGDLVEFDKLMRFINETDLSTQDGLEQLNKILHVQNFIQFVGTHLFFANEDFPNNNVRMWRERSFGKKWNFFFYDCDACMRDVQQDSFHRFTSERNDGNPVSILLEKLLKNTTFSHQLAEFLLSASSNEFESAKIIANLRSFQDEYIPLIQNQIKRWSNPEGIEDWNSSVQIMENFAIQRKIVINELIEKYLNEPFTVFPIPASDVLNIEFKINVHDIPFHCEAFSLGGQKFSLQAELTDNQTFSLDTSVLSAGLYILSIDLSGTLYYKKISVF